MKNNSYDELFALVATFDNARSDTTLGSTTPIDKEPVRLINDPSLSFVTHAADQLKSSPSGQTRLRSPLFGLLGPIGAMPYIYSEIISRASRANEMAAPEFLQIFSHRAASLMYRAWRKSRISQEVHPGALSERQRKFSGALQGLTGSSGLPERIAWLDVDRQRPVHAADLFTRRVRNASGLRQLLCRQFGMTFKIREFAGSWEPLPEEARSSFGGTGGSPRLGYTSIIGSKTWQVQSSFCVVIDHPTAAQYEQLQPGSESLRRIQLAIRMYCTPELSFRIDIAVKGADISAGTLGGAAGKGAVLGWNTMGGQPDKDKDYALSICRDYNESRMNS